MNDFCVFILTHGRAGNVHTYRILREAGYTGKVYIVIDDEDDQREAYQAEFGDQVLIFPKEKMAETIDEADNFHDRRAIVYARNACFDLAHQVGCKYFMQLDDDYTRFSYRFNEKLEYSDQKIHSMDTVLGLLLKYYKSIPAAAIAIAIGQGGDYMGGEAATYCKTARTTRKVMNTFICSTDRPFKFFGRINEDVNVYTNLGRRGVLFLTILGLSIVQKQTQSRDGGMTNIYLDGGTYIKSFYSVMYSPSCVKVMPMGEVNKRLHHQVSWNNATPKILHSKHKR